MKSHSKIFSPTVLAALCGIALAAGIVSTRAHADQWDRRTTLTVNQPIQVRDTVLDPGTYVFKLYGSSANRHIVQIFNGDESHIIDTVQVLPKYRMRATDDSQFTFWETPSGTAHALRAWFYPGDTIGQEFPYPNEPKQLAMLQTASGSAETPASQPITAEVAPLDTPAQPQAATDGAAADLQKRQPAEAAENQPAEGAENQPAEVAENMAAAEPAAEAAPIPEPEPAQAAPPAATQAPPPAPPDTTDKPAQMPKTASPYPLIGLCGLFSLSLGGLLRLIRSA